MQVAWVVETELWPEEDGDGSRSNTFGLGHRYTKAQTRTKYVAGVGFSFTGPNSYQSPASFTRFGPRSNMSGTENGTRSTVASSAGPSAMSHNLSNRTGVSSAQSSTRKNEFEKRFGFEKSRGVKHLTYSEMMDRKAQGQCFRCGEKFHPLHNCADRQLR